ncbi:DegT/DnrJ/EryC1/StrS family aminotransferase [Pseudoalteromonas shioyasakiensis]|uniref:DegT/DnrJ/EryC1/StrS family aminotransferase n=1 Tax=Pseudoalteromonas shioyasakiensis TaxID=1190813 RepID=UPI00211901C0|nr:DegT/DnrJ/EryC1/StrS family aminotransferase [Pseudoalteromonas shioyasakiensis]MCQ8882435.1 DegT/DnrJ/EryC1/StrS family aminotransferase [Pseudoalteromonas shioyasakiensis]
MGLAELEKELAGYFIRDHAILTRSGSFAIITALQCAGLEQGSKIIMPASCCPIVLFSIQMAGYSVVLADVSLGSLSMEVEQIESVMDDDVSAILAVHGYGHFCAIDEITDYAKRNGVILIEDACLAYGGKFKGRPIGSFGDFSVISFGYDKPISQNYGGALMTNSQVHADKARCFLISNEMAQFSNSTKVTRILESLKGLDRLTDIRKSNIAFIEKAVSNQKFKKLEYNPELTYWRYPLFIEDRERFLKEAKQQNILFTSHYRSLGLLQTQGNYPNAEEIGNNIVNLFVQPATPQTQLTNMVRFINDYR